MLSGGNRNRRRRVCKKANKGFKQTVKTTRGAEEGKGEKKGIDRMPPSPPHAQQTFDLEPNPPDEKGVSAAPGGFWEPERGEGGDGMLAG